MKLFATSRGALTCSLQKLPPMQYHLVQASAFTMNKIHKIRAVDEWMDGRLEVPRYRVFIYSVWTNNGSLNRRFQFLCRSSGAVFKLIPCMWAFRFHSWFFSLSLFVLDRYEQGLEDYEEAADRVDREKNQASVQQYSNGMPKPILALFNVISSALSSGRALRVAAPDPSLFFGSNWRKSDDGRSNSNSSTTISSKDKHINREKSTSGEDDDNDNAHNQSGNEYFGYVFSIFAGNETTFV